MTIGGAVSGKACIFPFKFYNNTYNECTWNEAPTGKAWCSILVDSNGNHIEDKGKWGECGQECPIERKIKKKSQNNF